MCHVGMELGQSINMFAIKYFKIKIPSPHQNIVQIWVFTVTLQKIEALKPHILMQKWDTKEHKEAGLAGGT